jgi:hypothetical protein
VIFLGDTTRHGLAALAVLGFALAVACAVALARFGEAGEKQQPQPARAQNEALTQAAGRRVALGHRELPDRS